MPQSAYVHVTQKWQNVLRKSEDYRPFFQHYRQYVNPWVETFAYSLTPDGIYFLLSPATIEKDGMSCAWLTGFQALEAAMAEYRKQRYRLATDFSMDDIEYREISGVAQLVDEVATIHLAPVQAGLCSKFEEWRHSSYRMLLSGKKTPLQREAVFNWFGGREAFLAYHAKALETRVRVR